MPRPIATAAAIAVDRGRAPAAAAAAAARAGRRSAARRARPRGCGRAAPGGGAGPSAATASAPVTSQKDASSSWHVAQLGEMRLERLPLGRVERIQRVARGQLVDSGFHDPSSVASSRSSRSAREPGEHPALDRTERHSEPLGQLGLREAAVVGELDRLPLRVRQLAQRGLHALALEAEPGRVLGQTRSSPRRRVASSSGSARRRSSRRTRSTARRCTSVRIHVLAFARSARKPAAVRQTPRNASCTASSASRSSRRTRKASP